MLKHLILAIPVTLMAACSHEGSSPSSQSDWGTGLNTINDKSARWTMPFLFGIRAGF